MEEEQLNMDMNNNNNQMNLNQMNQELPKSTNTNKSPPIQQHEININKGAVNDISQITKLSKMNANRIKPKYFKLLGQVMNYHMDPILNYLDLKDLSKLRASNKLFLAIIHEYHPKRLRFEVERIKSFQEENYGLFLNFMKTIDSQIPISHKNWLDFELNSVINKIKSLDKKVISGLRAIKHLGKLAETVFAPFCIIMGYNVSVI